MQIYAWAFVVVVVVAVAVAADVVVVAKTFVFFRNIFFCKKINFGEKKSF